MPSDPPIPWYHSYTLGYLGFLALSAGALVAARVLWSENTGVAARIVSCLPVLVPAALSARFAAYSTDGISTALHFSALWTSWYVIGWFIPDALLDGRGSATDVGLVLVAATLANSVIAEGLGRHLRREAGAAS